MSRSALCLVLAVATVSTLHAQSISPGTRAWLDHTLVVLMDSTYSLEHAETVVGALEPDLMDWHFGIYGNTGDVYHRHGARVSGGAWQREYQEYVTWYDRDWQLRMEQFDDNGVGRLPDGSPVWDGRTRYCASMCHNAPKWHTWHNQGLLMPVGLADTISQDNIDVAGFAFGRGAFCRWCLGGFREYLMQRFDADALAAMGVVDVAALDFADYLRTTHPAKGPALLEDPLCREYLKYQHISMLDNWRDVCRKVRAEAAHQGVPIPPIYGNQYAAQTNSFGLHQCTEVDVVWIEDGTRLPTPTDAQAWSTLRYKIGLAAGGHGQPVWSCLYPSSADARLTVLCEALANGGAHVANSPDEAFARFAAFVRENCHLFADRERVARVGIIASPTTWVWGQFPELGLRESRTRELFTASARALEDCHVPYGTVVFQHPAVVDEQPCLAELDRYDTIIAAGVECLSAGQEVALERFVDRGGRLVVVGEFGIYDEDHVSRTPPDFSATVLAPEQVEALMDMGQGDVAVAATRSAFADLVDPVADDRRLIVTDGGPRVWANLWQHRGRRLDVHLVNYSTDGGNLVPTAPIEIAVLVPEGMAVSAASIVGPDLPRQAVDIRREGNRVHVRVPSFDAYAIVSLGDAAEMTAARELARAAKALDRLEVAGEEAAAAGLVEQLAAADGRYEARAYRAAEASARQVAVEADAALAESVERTNRAETDERLARIERGKGAALALDFGERPTDGWVQVAGKTAYDADRGLGWLITDALGNAGAGEPDTLHGDWISSEQPRTLRLNLDPGAYRVSVITGELNESYHWGGDVEVAANGEPMLVGIKRRGGVWRTDEFVAAVTDSILDLTFSSRPAWWPMTYPHEWSVAGVIIEAVSGVPPPEALPLTDWLVSGPYSDNEWTRIQQAEAPPDGLEWRSYTTPPGDVPIVDFRHLFAANDEAAFVGRTALVAAQACQARLHIGMQARGKVWLNGELILHDEKASGLSVDEYTVPLSLNQGTNVLEVLTSTDWIGSSLTASLSGAEDVVHSLEGLRSAVGATPAIEYPEPVIVCEQPVLTLGVPMDVSVRFTNLSDTPQTANMALTAPNSAAAVRIEPLHARQDLQVTPRETVLALYRVTMIEPVDTVDAWHHWSLDVPDTVKLVAHVRYGDEERSGYRWLPAASPRLEATLTRAAMGGAPAELKLDLHNPTDQAVSGSLRLTPPEGWDLLQAPPAELSAEPGQSATATSSLQPGTDAVPGEYAAQAGLEFRPGGGEPVQLLARCMVALVGIAGEWRFDEGEGAAVSDASPRHNDGTVGQGLVWTEGRRGSALQFDGTACVQIAHSDSISIVSGVTVEAWVKPDRFVGNDMIVVKTDYSNEYLLYVDGQGTLRGRVRCGGTGGRNQDTIEATGALMPGVWQHIAFTWSRQAMRLYRDGELLKQAPTQCEGIGANTSSLCIGGGAYAGGFHGLIDDVVIRIGALSPADIKGAYERGR